MNIGVQFNKTRLTTIGACEFRGGQLTVAAPGVIPAGTLLKRIGDKFTFMVAADPATTPVFILSDDVEAAIAGDIPVQVVITGKVRMAHCHLFATPAVELTLAQIDHLRSFGIIAIDTVQLAELDNH